MKKAVIIAGLVALLVLVLALLESQRMTGKRAETRDHAGESAVAGATPRSDSTEPATLDTTAPTVAVGAANPRHRQADAPASPVEKLLAGAATLVQRELPGPAPGTSRRERLVSTAAFKYPLLRVVETLDAAGRVTARSVTVGDHVLVRVRDGVSDDQVRALAARHGGTVRKKMYTPGHYLIAFAEPDLDTVPQGVTALAAAADLVQWAEPDKVVEALAMFPNDPDFGRLWGLHNTGQSDGVQTGFADSDIDAPEAWETGTGTTNVVVGVIDTGVDYTHMDLATNIWRNSGEIPGNNLDDDGNGLVDDVYGWDFYNEDNDPMDDHGHGTHCAGTIGAVGNNGLGVVGVCWRVKIMALKFLGSSGSGTTSDAVDAIHYATRMRAWLTSNSWGGGDYDQSLFNVIETAGQSNCLFVAAAGNAANNNDATPTYPASFTNANIIAVAATDNRDALAYFSNYGATSVDLGAPGVQIWSTKPGNSYQYLSGTSMATPHVAGACAWAWSVNPTATAAKIKQSILSGAEPIPSLAGKCVTGGRLNLQRVLPYLGMYVAGSVPAAGSVLFSAPTSFVISFTDPYTTSSVQAADLTVNGLPANSVTFNSPTNVTFGFTSTPVTVQGLQTMSIAENSITRQSDGAGVAAWLRTFRYDALALAVTSTVPANGAAVTLPLTNLVFAFNEPVDTNAVAPSALQLSQGGASAVSFLDASTVVFTVTNIGAEGTLTYQIAAGAITDVYGNPCLAYSGTNTLDFGTIEFPINFKSRRPAGSLVYEATVAGAISSGSDTDAFILPLDAPQTLSVLVTPGGAGLRPSIEVRDPTNAVLGSATATAAGQPVRLELLPILAAGDYTLTISGADGTTGSYSNQVLLNAAWEAEPNDSLATAQNLNAAFITLTGGVSRAAVIGSGSTDWYSFAATAGDRVSAAVRGTTGLELYTGAGTRLATGVAALDKDWAAVDEYLVAAGGTYYARITSGTRPYTLVVTRNAAFGGEANDTTDNAQPLGGRGVALGGLGHGGALFAVDMRTTRPDRILRLNPDTGAILASFDAPLEPLTNPYGLNLAYDGRALWFNAGAYSGNNKIYKLDPNTGAVLTNFVASGLYPPLGLAYLRDELYVADDNGIHVYSATNFAYRRFLPVPANAVWLDGLAGDDRAGYLYAVAQETASIYRLDPMTGKVLATVPTVRPNGGALEQGMAVVDDELFVSHAGIGGSTTNAISVYDADTLTWKRTFPVTVGWMIGGLGGDGVGMQMAWYSVAATNNDELVLTTLTPGGEPAEPGQFRNPLDPVLLLYAPDGSLISSNDNGAADGKNARITHTATTNGNYRIAVFGQNRTLGSFLLTVTGTTAAASFHVTAVTPANGVELPFAPTQLTFDFNRHVLLTSVQASDVTVDGTPCTGFTVVDGDTLRFTPPSIGGGPHTIAIAAGAILDLAGTPLQAFSSTFTVDVTPPSVIATSVGENGTVPAGPVTFWAQFSEPMRAENMTTNIYIMVGAITGTNQTAVVSYNTSNAVLYLEFADLPQDYWTLTLRGGDGLLEDIAGNNLAGGNFVRHFYTDIGTTNLPAPFTAGAPLGSLIYHASRPGYIGPAGDTDSYTMSLDAGQTVSVAARPVGAFQPTIALSGPGGLITNLTGVALQSVPVTTAGTYTVTIGGDGFSTGGFTVQAVLNAAIEEELLTGLTNGEMTAAQSLTGATTVLTGAVTRAAAWGVGDEELGPDGYGYRGFRVPFEFQDISGVGTRVLTNVDDAFVELTAANLNGFAFNFYGTTYSNLFINSNGLITFGSGTTAYLNTNLTVAPTQPTIAVFWDDLYTTTGAVAGVYWRVTGTGNNQELTVQWHKVKYVYNNWQNPLGQVTFQAVLKEADNSMQFNYLDLSGPTNTYVEGSSATVGIKDSGTQGARRLLVSFDNGPNAYVGSGKSTRISASLPASFGRDLYAVDLSAGDRATLVSSLSGGQTNLTLQLLAGNGAVLATGQVRSNVQQVINGYLVPSNGTYYASIRAPYEVNYGLVVLRNGGFDLEPNDTLAQAQPLTDAPTVLGYLNPPSGNVTNTDYYSAFLVDGDTLTASTQTPGDGTNEFDNTLNPALELFGPTGSLVASNYNGAPDGRNAQLSYVVPTTGNYTVRVRPESGFGEYLLITSFPIHYAPQVVITSPTNNQQVCANTPVTVTATATDVDDNVVLVEFYANNVKFAEDTTAPYSAEWPGGSAGLHTLLTKAVDQAGLTNSSLPVTINVINCLGPVTPSPITNGVDYFYYVGAFSPSVTNLDTATPVASGVTSNFTLNVPARTTNDYFGLKFEGYVYVPSNGIYSFTTTSDDGSRLWIGTTNVVNNDGNHSARTVTNSIGLQAGLHPIRVSYYEATGGETLSVNYFGPGITNQVIPMSALWRLLPTVTITASDSQAAEWPLDGGQFTVSRSGNTNYLIAVTNAVTGTASNGLDYTLSATSVILSAGVTSATITVTPLPDDLAEGTETVVLSVLTNAITYAIGSPGSATVSIADKPFDAWRYVMFGGNANHPAIACATCDPDGDGLANLMEYALGLNPNLTSIAPRVAHEGDHLTLIYTRLTTATDVTLEPQATGSLTGGWSSAGITVEVIGSDGTIETNQATDNATISGNPSRFLRLKATYP